MVCAVIDLSTDPEVMLTLADAETTATASRILTPRSDNALDASGLNPNI